MGPDYHGLVLAEPGKKTVENYPIVLAPYWCGFVALVDNGYYVSVGSCLVLRQSKYISHAGFTPHADATKTHTGVCALGSR